MTKLLDPRKPVKQVQNVSGTKGEGVDFPWTQVVYAGTFLGGGSV